MRRVGYALAAICMAFAFTACSDDSGTNPGSDGGKQDGGGGNEQGITLPETSVPDSTPPGPSCDKSVLGKVCTSKDNVSGGECGDPAVTGATCLLTDNISATESRGVCTCQCTADDPQTPLVNEDSCPDLSAHVCGSVGLTDGSTQSFCFRKCDPKLGSNACEGKLACDPRSGSQVGLFEDAVCMFFGCETGADCPVFTAKECKTDGSVACDAGDECIPLQVGGADGLCAKPGKCDTASGLCGVRDANFKAGAKVGDACKDDTECDKNMRCERETDTSKTQKAGGETCTENTECCSGRCTSGKCEPGTCTIHSRNGYCYVRSCAFTSLTEFQCPTGSSCSILYSGGICFKDCTMNDAASCRGNANDKLGDYECRSWNNISIGGVGVTAGPVCEWGDTLACNTFSNLDCPSFGEGQQNPTNMVCRDLKDAKLTDAKDPLGFCLDDTASGPVAN